MERKEGLIKQYKETSEELLKVIMQFEFLSALRLEHIMPYTC